MCVFLVKDGKQAFLILLQNKRRNLTEIDGSCWCFGCTNMSKLSAEKITDSLALCLMVRKSLNFSKSVSFSEERYSLTPSLKS